MSVYVGRAFLLDDSRRALGTVRLTLASDSAPEGRWFGNVQSDLGGLVRTGDHLVVQLPGGLEGEMQATIDLTGEEPVIRLRGIGRAPI